MAVVDIFNTDKKYSIIYADPPWRYSGRQYQSDNRPFKPTEAYYPTMPTESINALPVKDKLTKDAFLFLWVTNSHIPEGLALIASWGFKYKTIAFVWLKQYKNGSYCVNYSPWTLPTTEVCLLGVKGHPRRESRQVRQLIEAERTKHSKKPDITRTLILDLCGDLPRIELFARQQVEGWDCWGNEV